MPEALFLLSGYAKARMLDMLVDRVSAQYMSRGSSYCDERPNLLHPPEGSGDHPPCLGITLLAWGLTVRAGAAYLWDQCRQIMTTAMLRGAIVSDIYVWKGPARYH